MYFEINILMHVHNYAFMWVCINEAAQVQHAARQKILIFLHLLRFSALKLCFIA